MNTVAHDMTTDARIEIRIFDNFSRMEFADEKIYHIKDEGVVASMDNKKRPCLIPHFTVYQHPIMRSGELSTYRMIVLRDADGRITCFTGLEAFSYEYTGQVPKIQVRRKQELVYICRALNDICEYNQISHLNEITSDMIFEFFDDYCSGDLTERSLSNCVTAVSHFFANLAACYDMKFTPKDLLHTEYYKRHEKAKTVYRKYIPRYVVPKKDAVESNIPRDIPLRIVQMLVDLADKYDPMISFAIVAQTATGLRGSGPMNMRQIESPVSADPGLRFTRIGDRVTHISIDMTKTYRLREDGKSVGGIKRKRTVQVYPKFIEEFCLAYQKHLQFLKRCNVDPRYMPMFVNRDGQAMTYATYRYRLHKLIEDHLIPKLLESENPEDVLLAQRLRLRKLSPHIFRHVFTVRLVLEGLDVAQIQMYRGDKNPESALTYMADKGELVKRLIETHDLAISGLAKGGGRLYDPTIE